MNFNGLKRLAASGCTAAALYMATALPSFAQDAAAAPAPTLDTGDTAWMLTSTALVLMMTIPGLALFYGGMVRKKNVLAVLMQCFVTTCLVTVLWVVCAYSLAFTTNPIEAYQPYIGGLDKFLLAGVGKDSLTGTIPESVFMTFQMTFAIITPALIIGRSSTA
jgi:Amt family ammonium transporter